MLYTVLIGKKIFKKLIEIKGKCQVNDNLPFIFLIIEIQERNQLILQKLLLTKLLLRVIAHNHYLKG